MPFQPPWHHLLPFLASVAASFAWFVPRPSATVTSMVLKCLPVVVLAAHLFYLERWTHKEGNLVFVALLLSALGDAFLVFPKPLGIPGVIAFGLAQVAYTVAFGFETVTWSIGIVLYLMSAAIFISIYLLVAIPPNYKAATIVMLLYSFVIATMLWRAIDRYYLKDILPFERRILTSIGAFIFVISDLSIVFLQGGRLIPQPYSKGITMATYYVAQLLITLGASKNFWKVDEDTSSMDNM